MAKIVDITDKLDFEENPKLKIKDVEIEVNADAETILKVMGLLDGGGGAKEVLQAYELIVSEKERKKIIELGLKFSDFQTVITEAINLVTGESEPGEQ